MAPSLEANMPAEDERTLSEVVEFLSTSESVWSLGLAHMSLLGEMCSLLFVILLAEIVRCFFFHRFFFI